MSQQTSIHPAALPRSRSSLRFWGIFSAALLAAAGLIQIGADSGWINQYYLHIVTIIGMNVILVASLNLLNGYLGEFALGHAGFMAIGAYTAALIATGTAWPALPGLVLSLAGAIALTGLIGYLIGLVTFKTVGDYLAIITLGFNMIIVNGIQNLEFVGGPRGFGGIPRNTNFFAVVCGVVFTYAVLRNLIASNYGRIWVAIRENDIAAELMGVNIIRAKNLAFTIAAALAGLAGGLWAQYQQFITPKSFDYIKTTEILVMLYLGGMGSLSGSILGVVVYTILMELLRNLLAFDPRLADLRMVISPLILIVIMLTRQYGLMGNKEWRWLRLKEERVEHGSHPETRAN
ncbi:amino acid/amide ABC transporter membrane protein 2 (HAAT family) [Hydrogenispora ethanolica]|uniref:Amino acid/amide ABC transporter membrane protein 2 (HAAT family) n=1 Tax=Hydrogenispora ethanolica TaxID=1082276 RepID=A0A4R1R8Z7_HYDET|nr:branched-chain amino acid ABC transporter permease [Hydrogenispora ethanolica]TCL62155.1 amino acid/amide ABC transporter membrane protein 2 (HAAT family) [Hydrogenispora ethanolica]